MNRDYLLESSVLINNVYRHVINYFNSSINMHIKDNRFILTEGFVIKISRFLNFESFEYNYLIYYLNIELSKNVLLKFENEFFKLNKYESINDKSLIRFENDTSKNEMKQFLKFFLFTTLTNKNNTIPYELIEDKSLNSYIGKSLYKRIEFETKHNNGITISNSYTDTYLMKVNVKSNNIDSEFYI